MTYIITSRTNDSILMASDSRLNYFHDKVVNGERCQEITAIADCMEKTFFIESANIGIQFQGIGYFPDNGENYPIAHFIESLENINYEHDFVKDSKKIFDFFYKMSVENDTGQYVKGIMTGFDNGISYIATFNTFNNQFSTQQLFPGNFVDSENSNNQVPVNEKEAIAEIKNRIKQKEKEKWWTIGGPIDILKITNDSFEFIEKNTNTFCGNQNELLDNFKNNIGKINGKILKTPKTEKYNL